MKRLLFLCLALATPQIAAAAVPSPANSSVPCLVVCPRGDLPFEVVVRDIASVPIAGSLVQIQLCLGAPTPPIAFCQLSPPCTLSGFTDATGHVTFIIQAGGVDPSGTVQIRADGVVLANRVIASPDQNGDLVVNATDVGFGMAAVGTPLAIMDLDCDGGLVDAADVGVINNHLGHDCGQTAAPPPSWGRVKILYR